MNCKARTLRFWPCCCACTIRLCKRRTWRLARFQLMERQSTAGRRLAPAAPAGAASSSRRIPVVCVIVRESRTETPGGSQRGCPRRDVVSCLTQRLSRSLQSGLSFLRHLIPDLPSVFLAVNFPELKATQEKAGLTTFHVNHGVVKVSPRRRWLCCPRCRKAQPAYRPRTFWSQRDSLLRCLWDNGACAAIQMS